jgi:O-antigen/teichoic acid export membrane protein
VSIRQDTLRTLLFQVVALFAGVVTNIIVARTLGPEGKGLLAFLRQALFVAVNLGGLGLATAAVQHIGKQRFSGNTMAGTQLVLAAGLGVICAAGMALMLPLYRERMDLPPILILAFLPIVILSLVQTNLSGVFIGLGRIRDDNILRVLSPLAWMIGAVIVLGVLRANQVAGTLTWIVAQAVSAIAALAWVWVVARPRLAGFRKCARASLRFGIEAYLANLVWTLLLRADTMLLGYLSGAMAVGIYSVSVLLAEMLWYLSRALATALSPRIAGATREEAILLAQRAARLGFWAVLIAGLSLAVIVHPLVRLTFGRAFLPSVTPFLLLLPGTIFGALASPLSLYFTQQCGRPRVNALMSGAGLTVNLALNAFWIPRYGPSGAAAASSIAYTLVALLLVWRCGREPGFRITRLLRPRREDVELVRELIRSARAALPGGRPA